MKNGARPLRLRVRAQNGTAKTLMMFASLEGGARQSQDRHTPWTTLTCEKTWLDVHFANARPSLWSRTLSTVHEGVIYELSWREARRLVERFNGTTRKKHGRCSIWRSSRKTRRSYRPSASTAHPTNKPRRGIDAWKHDRNAATQRQLALHNPNARIKLRHLYPSI